MKVILKQDIKKVGKKGDIVDVSDGYGRNYLIARGLAVAETKKSLEILGEQKAEEARLEAQRVEEAKQLAEENGVVLAEAMTIYHMPLYKKLQEVIRSGKLGKLCMAQMNFGSYKEYDMQNRFFNPNLAGGNPAYESGRRDGYDRLRIKV